MMAGWFAGIGLLFLVGCGVAFIAERNFEARTEMTDGIVVSLQRRQTTRPNGPPSEVYAAVFEFTLPDGRRQRVVSSSASNPPCCQVGEKVRVRYDAQRPDGAGIDARWTRWGVTIILGGIGMALLVMGAGGVIQGRRVETLEKTQDWRTLPIMGVRFDRGINDPRWYLQAGWSDPRTGAIRVFESGPFRFDPSPQLAGIRTVEVLFDPDRPDGPFEMDTRFLYDPDPNRDH